MRKAGGGLGVSGAASAIRAGAPGRSPWARRLVLITVMSKAAFLLGSCGSANWHFDPVDYLDRLDRITPHAGDAQARNIRMQSVNPVPDGDLRRQRTYDGRRAKAVMDRYYGLESGPAEASGVEGADGSGAGSGATP